MSAGVRFAGYAAIFDAIDRGGDVIRAGAFSGLPAAVPLLWQHRGAPVGAIERIASDARGLQVVARVDDPRLAALVRSGAVSGLSIGYRTRAARRGAGRVRELTALELVEVSLVGFPMQPGARVHRVADAARPGAPDAVPDFRAAARGAKE
ncbi:HK97 family phage prohead protease [Sphingomonas sp. PAMC 26605]|uniref:HK97 family phage prohead protease n=1 Tax=Sphingomonas sp. PAMC 26605 TaxID=1112214 RepID=UPI00026CA219|nr:HK97 family phage prohead protease [Sphingomonas sp. PAMC 26605]